MKRLPALFAAFFGVLSMTLSASAQEMYQLAGIYTPYPDGETAWTKAPAGYKAVYLAHYGRHGSRYHSTASGYRTILGIMERAERAGALTPLGDSLLLEIRKVCEEAEGRYGALAPRGVGEHRHIMQRVCRRYPELFATGSPTVKVYSSQSPRCLMSMAASTEVIKEFNPKVQFDRHCDDNMQELLFSVRSVADAASNASAYLKKKCAVDADPQPLLDRFFKDGGRYMTQQHRSEFGSLLQHISAAAYETGTDLWKYSTKEEMKPYWQKKNSNYYYIFGPSEEFSELSRDRVGGLLLNMLQDADKALAAGGSRASLRYGHDTMVIPLADLLGIEGCCAAAAPGQAVEEVWRNYEVTPMGVNLQMLFFRKGKDVLVKVLHNEKEVRLAGIQTDRWPFYHWTELRKTLYDRVERMPSFRKNGWQRDTVAPGLVYMRYSGYEEVTRANQLVSVAVVDLNDTSYSVDFSYSPVYRTTSEAFRDEDAIVSMNASYECESVVIKTEGVMRGNIPSDVVPFEGAVPQWKSDCAICTDGRRVSIEYTGKDRTLAQMREAYAAMQWPEIFGSAPMLIENGVPVGKYFAVNNYSPEEIKKLYYEDPIRHQSVRHPRCAVALTADNRLILICVDGRRPGVAEGMNAWELTTFIQSQFNPVNAINMDGGGSSTMCVKGRGCPSTNVVNYPSKSPVYNHQNERRLPTHIHILKNKKPNTNKIMFEKLSAKPAPCTDMEQLKVQYEKNPAAWDSAEHFLSGDLANASTGRHELEGGAYANVQEYNSKEVGKFEYHENYIDIQYVVAGVEQIGICPRANLLSPMGAYNPEKDCALFESAADAEYVKMQGDGFFTILFPNEAHCPGMKVGESVPVKKVVVKIPYIK